MYGLIIILGLVGQQPEQTNKLYEAHNEIREKYSQPKFEEDKYLNKYADWWVKKMSERRSLRHSNIGYIMKYGYSAVGENIAMGQQSDKEVMNSWMKSRGHRNNILNPRFNRIGCARYKNWWCVVFGRKSDE